MCGIAGVFVRDGGLDRKVIRDMTFSIRHRGPDDEGYLFYNTYNGKLDISGALDTPQDVYGRSFAYSPKKEFNEVSGEFNLFLGHRRLSIIDTSPSGHQPMCNDDGKVWIVFNGEIYNYIEIREELKRMGFRFNTSCDTEVILKAYEAWDERCLDKFIGMWAFVILDLRKNIIFGARDRFGVKPFYYYKDDKHFSFASEIKSILCLPFYKKGINEKAVFDYLVNGLEEFDDESFFKNIFELKPSNYFLFNLKNGDFKAFIYYSLPYRMDFEDFSEDRAKGFAERIRELTFKAVDIRLRSDVPVGTCLSGGLDSSSIVCIINKLLQEKEIPVVGDRQKVFTASYKDSKIDESSWAKIVVDRTKTSWYQTFPVADDLLNDLENLVYYQDIPFGSTSIYAQYRVMKLAKENGVKVLLDGQGGDELFGGYHTYFKVYLAELIFQGHYSLFLKELKEIRISGAKPLKGVLKNILSPLLPGWVKRYSILIRNPLYKYLNKGFLNKFRDRIFLINSSNLNDFLAKHISFLNLKTLLKYEDRNSMRFSLEARTPFADDKNLIEEVFQMPSSYKIHNGWTKYLLRLAMEDVLPKEIQWRRDKIGFATPEKQWIEINDEFFKGCIINSNMENIFDVKEIINGWDNFLREEKNDSITNIWRIINLVLWGKIYRL